jgi:signal transduction histidine kinase
MQSALITIDEQTDRLVRLVNDLLALSRLQRGELRLERTSVDLAQLARSTAGLVEPKAQRLGLAVRLDLPTQLPPVEGDPDRLQQAVLNLLDNALRFAPAGSTVQVSLAVGEGEIILRVLDDGRGLTADELEHAFEPYYRGAGGGAGLGLTIAREIVLAHSGRIWLRPRPEGGAEVGFSLPTSPP